MDTEMEEFRKDLPLLTLSLVGRALNCGMEVDIVESQVGDMTVTFFDTHSGKSVTLRVSEAVPSDIDEVEYLISDDSVSFE